MHVGERIAGYRKRRGLSQDALAGLAGRSRSWLSQVERGMRGVDRLSTLSALAQALHVDVGELIAGDWRLASNGAPQVRALDAIRTQLAGYHHLIGQPDSPWPLPQLRNAAVQVNQAYQAARYADAAAMLPGVLSAADGYIGFVGRNDREVHLARCSVYSVCAKLLTKVGEPKLAWIAADRATHAALSAGSPTGRGMAAVQVAGAMLADDRGGDAERVAIGVAEQLMPNTAAEAPEVVSIAGALWLLGAVIAGRDGDRRTAEQRLGHADELAQLLARDANHGWTAFGRTNVLIHRASVGAELGDAGSVLELASQIDVDDMPEGLNSRRARLHLDLAWAQTQAKRDLEAVLHLQQAERIAPEVLRFDSVARELLRELLKRARRPMPALTALAKRSGVLA
ncbi:helix-turn-helix domain-containing protein [Angustibacter sp. McL0619]|uniref:helix-turn-helix domain-containing protein n=1 Tax=Angustibacter sp. McL0619 TaxID=3415676 RepID=UPI003CF508EC